MNIIVPRETWMKFESLGMAPVWCCTYEIILGQATNAKASKIIVLGVFGFSFGRPMNEDRCRIEVINPSGYINTLAKGCYKVLHSDIDQNSGE